MRAILPIALLVACTSGPTGAGERATAPLEPTTRDSAGVVIHEHPADALARAPVITMEPEPLATIGGADVANDLTRVFAVVLLPNGHTAAFDPATGSVRFHDADGIEVARHGRSGEGPGEFGRGFVSAWGVGGDTVAVSDPSSSRLSLVTEAGGVIAMHPAAFRHAMEVHAVVGRFQEGGWVLAPGNALAAVSAGDGPAPTGRPELALGRVRADARPDRFDTLLVVPGTEIRRYRTRMFGLQEDLVDGVIAFAARTYVHGWDGLAAVMTNEHWEVRRHAEDGHLVSVVRVLGPLRPVSDSLVTAWKEGTLAAARERAATAGERGADLIASTESYLENTPRADSVPPFRGVQGGGKVLWLLDYQILSSDSQHYTAVHADGRLLGRIALGPTVRVAGFADDRIAIRTEDDDGIARIVVHRLVMP